MEISELQTELKKLKHYLLEIDQVMKKLRDYLLEIEQVILNAHREISMWREEFMENETMKNLYTENERAYIFNLIQNHHFGIENIYEFVEKNVKSYRETLK